MQMRSVDFNKLRGFGDKFVGLSKEFFGSVFGNDRLQREGEAQQEKATETLRALRKELEAETKDAKAEAHEQRQKAAQRVKENA